MRLVFAAALLLAACADAPAPAAPADPASAAEGDETVPTSSADDTARVIDRPPPVVPADLEGDWFFCSGGGALDETATFEGGELRTYLHDRPAMTSAVALRDGVLTFDGRTFQAMLDGEVLTLDGDIGPSVYARSAEACP